MWNSSPRRISYLAVLPSQRIHHLTCLARCVEPWAEDDARKASAVAGGFVLDDQEPTQSNVREYRQKAGLSREALARELGVSRQTVVNIEKGLSEPKVLLGVGGHEI